MNRDSRRSLRATAGARLIAVLLGLAGLWLAGGGAWLVSLGGSAYYLVAGIACLLSALLYLRGRAVAGLCEVGVRRLLLLEGVGFVEEPPHSDTLALQIHRLSRSVERVVSVTARS